MLKSLILLTLALNIAFAKDRFTEADKKKFLEGAKQEIAEHKVENRGRVDLQIIKPAFYQELEVYLQQEKFTRDEMIKIKQKYEEFSRDPSIKPERAEAEFYNFIERELSEISKKPLEKTKEGFVCNKWGCEDGLKCAPDPLQESNSKRKRSGEVCAQDNDCASGECVEETVGSKKKVCEDIYRCYRPLTLGQACNVNPVCGAGACLPFSSLTSGIGECKDNAQACKSNSDCCSNMCEGRVCKPNFICKDCVSNGSRPQRGQKCCEGLYMNENGVCVPDVPPTVIPQVKASPVKTIFVALASLVISTADAADAATENTTPASPATENTTIADPEKKDETFVGNGAKDDGLDLKAGVMANKDNLGDIRKSTESKALDMNEKKPDLKFDRKSNFTTCDIKFKDDFYNALKKDGTFDLEVAMLAFDFVITGESDSDYWTKNQMSLYDRLKNVGIAHRKVRQDTNKKIETITKQLTCACLDVQGYTKITNQEKKSFFEKNCEEYAKYTDPNTPAENLSGDASGLKAKRLLTIWTRNLMSFHASLTVDNNAAYKELLAISNWANGEAKWTETKQRNYDLFKFNIKNPSNSVAGLGALVGALLAAGVIAILGGFATTSILSTWAAVGIISASAATGAGGLWMIATLKGAWITLSPEISDTIVAPRGYSCGKKETCMEYTRTLVQPYNDICKIHASANACLKSFVVVNEGNDSRFVVDPWIPVGVPKASILMNQPLYTEKLEKGFEEAKAAMIGKNPGAAGGGGKKGGGEFVSEQYLSEVFIDQNILAKYAPKIGNNLQSTYFLSGEKIKLIKEAAKKFAIEENFLLADDKENLEAFADYAYEYHFVWPKKSRPDEISYPTVGLSTYLNFMAKNVSGNLTSGLAKTTTDLGKLHQQYLKDLQNNLLLYKESINGDQALKANIAKEADNIQKELDSILTMNAMLDNKELDSQLMNLGPATIADYSKLAGANGAGLSGDQTAFLKAVGNLRSTRKAQLKSLAAYNKAMSGNKDRMDKMAAVSKKFTSNFATGRSSFGSGNSSLYAAGDSSSNDSNKNNSGNVSSGNFDTGMNSDLYGSTGGGLFGSTSGSGSSNKNNSDSGAYSSTGMSASAQSDAKKLSDAIDARNKSSSKYQSRDGLSLFEKVTNAYIRNYDKVLMKKKDKDVVEDKQ